MASSSRLAELKQIATATVERYSGELAEISTRIWSKPELNYAEYEAHKLLTDFLEAKGFDVKKSFPLETSFVATFGSGGLRVGICAEYDALPDVDHACGHNLIAESSIGAALALQEVVRACGGENQVVVFGTPAEEGGGGKVKMIEAGVFNDVDICIMAHPAPIELGDSVWLARDQMTMVFHGRAAHAAAAPWEGVNALDAAVACYNSISMLRQQMKPDCRVHGVFKDGGEKPNIIPRRAELQYYIRAERNEDVADLKERIIKCAQGAAMATGCTVDTSTTDPFYSAVFQNSTLMGLYMENQKSQGVPFDEEHLKEMFKASTDMGNVSVIKPAIHPLYKIATKGVNHTPEFNEAANDPANQLPTLNVARSLAMTAIDVMCQPHLLDNLRADFAKGPPR